VGEGGQNVTCAISGPQLSMESYPSPTRPRGCMTFFPRMLIASMRRPMAIRVISLLC